MSEIRSLVAKQIIEARNIDRNSVANVPKTVKWWYKRDGQDYLLELQGIFHGSFSYIKTRLDSPRVLDIGTGSSRGICEISKSPLSSGIDFLGTDLIKRKEHDDWLGSKNIRITIAETLSGIKARSIGMVIGVRSVSYSTSPQMVAASIDRVLVPGGLVKLSLASQCIKTERILPMEQTAERYSNMFKELGYGVDLLDTYEKIERNIHSGLILHAVKPGLNTEGLSKQIRTSDMINYIQDANRLSQIDFPTL